MKVCGIYRIVQLSTGKSYVGQSTNIKRRVKAHTNALEKGTHHSKKLQRSWRKYGSDDFRFEVLESCEEEKLDEKEQFFIDNLESEFNICKFAQSRRGTKISIWHRERISQANRGKKLSKKERENLSAANRGKRLSQTHKEKISSSLCGRKLTEEHKGKMRLAQKKRWSDPKGRAKQSERLKEALRGKCNG